MFKSFLGELGVKKNHNIIVHSSLKKIRSAFPAISPQEVIESIERVIGYEGSIIMPAFTYCFKSRNGDNEIFNRANSKTKVGIVSEVFRNSSNVTRTFSPTHSFTLWGKATKEISSQNSPASPLGEGSVLDWLAGTDNSFVLMLGTHFDSLSFGHYIEIKASVPWYDYFCWDHLGKEKVGVSVTGEQILKEIPGCSKSFINFESYLVDNKIIQANSAGTLEAYYIPVELLMKTGISYFKNNYEKLLCVSGSCKACDLRRDKFVK